MPLRFKVDENLPDEVRDLLVSQHHDAMTVRDQSLIGTPDSDLLLVCKREDRAFMTLDLDFADARFVSGEPHPGVIVIRAGRQEKSHVLSIVARLLPTFAAEQLRDSLWIEDETRIRIRSTRG